MSPAAESRRHVIHRADRPVVVIPYQAVRAHREPAEAAS